MDSSSQTYRQPLGLLIFGLVFGLAGLGFSSVGVYGLVSGTSIPMSVNDGPVHPATHSELVALALFPLIHATVGVALILYWLNGRVTASADGLVGTNLLGRENFRASWSELDRLERRSNRNMPTVVVFTVDGRKLNLTGSALEPVTHMVRLRAPHIKTTGWP
ncbi:MAG: hypothetical protein ACAH95_05505 [Fimbriimonas sp.]